MSIAGAPGFTPTAVIAALTVGLLAGCQRSAEPLTVTGSLTYRERIALPPRSVAVVEIRERTAGDAPAIAEQRIELDDRQVPIPFELTVDRSVLGAAAYELHGAITIQGTAGWVTEPVAIDPARASIDLGTLDLTRQNNRAAPTFAMRCGGASMSVEQLEPERVRVTVEGDTFEMVRVPAASGARYEVEDDPSTLFWSRGDRAMLEVRGQAYPECRMAEQPNDQAQPSFTARGNEPGWRVDVTSTGMTLVADYGETRIELPAAQTETSDTGRRYVSRSGDQVVTVTVTDEICADDMTGMPYPNRVTVEFDGGILRGCGGEPSDLLSGDEWVVEDINGGGIIDRSRVTLMFESGRVAGRASCNQYTAEFSLTGEGLSIGSAAVTRRACGESLMRQEERFLETLGAVRRFSIDRTGALILHADDGRTLLARR